MTASTNDQGGFSFRILMTYCRRGGFFIEGNEVNERDVSCPSWLSWALL